MVHIGVKRAVNKFTFFNTLVNPSIGYLTALVRCVGMVLSWKWDDLQKKGDYSDCNASFSINEEELIV